MWRYSVRRRSSRLSSPSITHYSNLVKWYYNATSSASLRRFTTGTLHYPEAPSRDQHNDLASYVAYAARTGLDVESNVYVGTHYEYSIAAALRPLGFDLRRVGGQSDKGIDLLGTWNVPSAPENLPLRVLLQCKAYTAKIGPQFIRELEGAYLGAPSGWRGSGVVGLLVTQRPATKGVREALARSRWPLGYVSCSKQGTLEQMLWNPRAEEEGLEGIGVTARLLDENRHGDKRHLVLTWKGRPYLPIPPSTRPEAIILAQEIGTAAKPG
jgi:hypothetical protein